ncbi:putative enzyme [Candidatus Nitrospira nitrosa]|uniref:Putative enzyme n=1 Tax=Candidatus Nitrospira nitrosa TaxID=1742972 RepID=A0A0S4L7F2_9BACT|nr:M20 family metallopeptidase [Candidatus Nitrospira nitrosa]CUS32698.1 putative enzyme [Candidatus Nitrospira nitrosa]
MALVAPELYDKLVTVRRELHRYPELSGQEARTATVISRFLHELGIHHRTNVAGHGVVADIHGRSGVPCVVLRADTDALPIQEETGLEFASAHNGIMHACGHDGHTTMLLGAAALLSQEKGLAAPVRLIFQPAEEKGIGAIAMIQEGALSGAGLVFGGHLDRHYRPGTIVVSEGPVNASSDNFAIEIIGQGAHGARPHESIDAVVVGSLMIMALQTIVSREVDPARPSVVSVGQFHAGTAPNVIAGQAKLEGTVRAQDPAVRRQLLSSVRRIAESIAQLHGAKIHVTVTEGTPPLVNDAVMAGLARQAAIEAVGEANVLPLKTANMGAEDFSYYLEKIPGAYVRFGSQVPGREGYPAHSSKFDFDEEALAVGAVYYRAIARIAGQQLRQHSTSS